MLNIMMLKIISMVLLTYKCKDVCKGQIIFLEHSYFSPKYKKCAIAHVRCLCMFEILFMWYSIIC